ncbi:MAG: SMP-30/gluconolactonase/LRE family protein [Pseudomonadales bacterium]|nr:SMP-30/gluconolactonase/LRE family protein [Pseudomonadales bacterium]
MPVTTSRMRPLSVRALTLCGIAVLGLLSACTTTSTMPASLVAPGAQMQTAATGFAFTEGPAADALGHVYFSDIPNNRIHILRNNGQLETLTANSNGSNGLFFDNRWRLFAAEGGGARISRLSLRGDAVPVISSYQGNAFNSPNDLWVDAEGGIYFTDPRYGNETGVPQDGYHVYYLPAGASEAIRIIDDMQRPNGIIGTRDGSTLYVADHGAGQTFAYTLAGPGELTDKRLFAAQGSDGVALDENGNLYLTSSNISVYNPAGQLIETIEVPLAPANLTFGGPNRDILTITARTTVFTLQMNVRGMY